VGLGGLAGLAYGGVELRARALESERFALSGVEVVGARRSSPAAVRARAGLEHGENVLALDLDAAAARVETLGWVARARLERAFPDRVRIFVDEHEPAALLALGELFYVDRAGRAFRAYVPGEPIDLPIVLGVDREGYKRDRAEAVGRLRGARDFLSVWRETRGAPPPQEVEVTSARLLRFTSPGGVSVWLGAAPWREALERTAPVIARLEREGAPGAELHAGRGRRADRVVIAHRGGGRPSGGEER
jgi:cell division protein FtsQ